MDDKSLDEILEKFWIATARKNADIVAAGVKAKAKLQALHNEGVRKARVAVIQSQIDFNFSHEENVIRLAQLNKKGEA